MYTHTQTCSHIYIHTHTHIYTHIYSPTSRAALAAIAAFLLHSTIFRHAFSVDTKLQRKGRERGERAARELEAFAMSSIPGYIYIYVCVYVYVMYAHVCVCVNVHVCIYTHMYQGQDCCSRIGSLCEVNDPRLYMYVCVIYVHVCVCKYTCVHIYTYVPRMRALYVNCKPL